MKKFTILMLPLISSLLLAACNNNSNSSKHVSNTENSTISNSSISNSSSTISSFNEFSTTSSQDKISSTYHTSSSNTSSSSNNEIDIHTIILSSSSTQLCVGETKKITIEILPRNATNKNIIWSSSNQQLATVDASGLVTAKRKGTVTIRATASNGVYGEIELTIIPVSPTSIKFDVDDIPIDENSLYVVEKGSTHNINVTVFPLEAEDKTYSLEVDSTFKNDVLINGTSITFNESTGYSYLTLTAKSNAVATLTDYINIRVLSSDEYSKFLLSSVFEKATNYELNEAISGSYIVNYTNGMVLKEDYEFYTDAIITKVENNNGYKYETFRGFTQDKTSFYQYGNILVEGDGSKPDTDVKKYDIVDEVENSSTQLTYEDAQKRLLPLMKYAGDKFGVSYITQNIYMTKFNKDNLKQTITSTQIKMEQLYLYTTTPTQEFLTIDFDVEGRLTHMNYSYYSYAESDYSASNGLNNNAIPLTARSENFYLNYGEKTPNPNQSYNPENILLENYKLGFYTNKNEEYRTTFNINDSIKYDVIEYTPLTSRIDFDKVMLISSSDEEIISIPSYYTSSLIAKKTGSVDLVFKSSESNIQYNVTLNIVYADSESITLIGIENNQEISTNTTININAKITPENASTNYNLEILEGAELISLIKQNDGTYNLTSLDNEGKVVLKASCVDNPSIISTISFNIVKEAMDNRVKWMQVSSFNEGCEYIIVRNDTNKALNINSKFNVDVVLEENVVIGDYSSYSFIAEQSEKTGYFYLKNSNNKYLWGYDPYDTSNVEFSTSQKNKIKYTDGALEFNDYYYYDNNWDMVLKEDTAYGIINSSYNSLQTGTSISKVFTIYQKQV